MIKYFIKKIGQAIFVLFAISFLAFGASFLAEGDPVEMYYIARHKPVPPEEVLEKAREEKGLNEPVLVQYKNWLGNFLKGNMGTSYMDDRPVADKIKGALPQSLYLAVPAFLLTFIFALAASITCIFFKDTAIDKFLDTLSFILASIPTFVYGVILLIIFAVKLKWFPVISRGNPNGWVLPALCLALPLIGKYTRQIRSAMMEEYKSQYVQSFEARGFKKRYIIVNSVFKNCAGLFLNLMAMSFAYFCGGVTIVEHLFVWPGLGSLIMDSILFRDYPTIQAFVFLSALIYFIFNMLADILHKVIDRRVDLG
ncbi:ABC transporter permease [uncultured Anaerococcus sp.]|uniref:ABC transporter permease n=1 Tax=uncultured Anaerococcus sp. TaxID=293428 RepID=UPI00288BFE88|nr:ABC transporter permease [uncultured Anaerococcus sp.]